MLPPKAFQHLLFRVAPYEAKSEKGKDMKLIGNRNQVAKAGVRKNSIPRFESDQFVRRHSPFIFVLASPRIKLRYVDEMVSNNGRLYKIEAVGCRITITKKVEAAI